MAGTRQLSSGVYASSANQRGHLSGPNALGYKQLSMAVKVRAHDMMLKATDTKAAPWYILHSDGKKRVRLNCISHRLSLIPYNKVKREKVKFAQAQKQGQVRRGNSNGRRKCKQIGSSYN